MSVVLPPLSASAPCCLPHAACCLFENVCAHLSFPERPEPPENCCSILSATAGVHGICIGISAYITQEEQCKAASWSFSFVSFVIHSTCMRFWVQVPPGFVFHQANSYIDTGTNCMVIICVRYESLPDFDAQAAGPDRPYVVRLWDALPYMIAAFQRDQHHIVSSLVALLEACKGWCICCRQRGVSAN